MNWKAEKYFKFLIPVVIFFFLGWQVVKDWPQVAGYFQTVKLNFFLASLPVLLLIYPEGAVCWWVVLRKLGVNISVRSAMRIWIIANTSRYIPGKIWQYVGRVELAKREAGIERSKTMFSLLLEIFLVVTAAGLVSILALPFVGINSIDKGFAIFLLPVLLILLHPKLANFILPLIAKFSKNKINIPFSLSFNQFLSTFPLYILNFLLNGLALYLLVISVYGDHLGIHLTHIFAISGFYAFSWTVGFLSIVAPGGLGVTEITLSYLLSFLMPLPLASSITILYRFLLTIAEFFIFTLSLKLGSKIR